MRLIPGASTHGRTHSGRLLLIIVKTYKRREGFTSRNIHYQSEIDYKSRYPQLDRHVRAWSDLRSLRRPRGDAQVHGVGTTESNEDGVGVGAGERVGVGVGVGVGV